MTAMQTWPDTRHEAPPADDRWRSVAWLLGRHPQLVRLADRLTTVDADGPDLDLNVLAEAINGAHAYGLAWADYERHCPPPYDDDAYDRWADAGPQPTPAVRAFAVMSSGEKARLRMVALFAYDRITVCIGDFAPLDDDGKRLLADWCQAVQAR